MLRSEYTGLQRLMWDAGLRRRFVANPQDPSLAELGPFLGRLLSQREVAGVEESAYYRIASCSRALATVFRHGATLLNAFGGLEYIEALLCRYLDAPTPVQATHELFDGYILAPEAIRVAREFEFQSNGHWLAHVLEYEWAVWHSRRCAMGWKPLIPAPRGLEKPAFLLRIPFELQALLDDIERMQAASVPEAVYRWRCLPNFKQETHFLIYAVQDDVATVELSKDAFENLQGYIRGDNPLDPGLAEAVKAHGLV